MKDKQGVLKAETQEGLQRWVEDFSKILNKDDPTNPVDQDGIEKMEEIKEIGLGIWRV